VIFFENIDCDTSPVVRLTNAACNGGVGRFGILADSQPVRLGGRVVDVLMAVIETSGRWSARTTF
jgi:hypothetical protein